MEPEKDNPGRRVLRDADRAGYIKEMERCLCLHRRLCPLMNAQDIVKFAFQGMLGVGHLIRSREDALGRLLEEMAPLEADNEEPLLLLLSPDFVRMNLRAAKAQGITEARIADMMIKSAGWPVPFTRRDVYDFCLCMSGSEEMKRTAAMVLNENWLPEHSRPYREAYRPAYRVLRSALTEQAVR